MAFFPCSLDWAITIGELNGLYPDRCTFKLKDGTVQGTANIHCRVGRSSGNKDEQNEGQRTTGESEVKLYLPAGTVVQPFWRAHIVYASGETAMLHVIEVPPPLSDEIEKTLRCKFVQE